MDVPFEATLPAPAHKPAPGPLNLEARQILAHVGADLFGDDAGTGRYEIRGKLGAGGMGVVYAAYDPLLDCDVALKQLHPHLLAETGFVERLRAEARAMARLRAEPHVVTLYDFFSQGSVVFVVMELVEGTTLRAWQSRPRRLDEVLEVYAQAGRGLAAAHRAGLVHRDFKPENVLLDRRGLAKVVDFGLAHAAPLRAEPEPDAEDGDSSTRPAIVGTPRYMAPEQLRGERVEPRSDQFSFCVALWEALFDEHPFFPAADASARAPSSAGATDTTHPLASASRRVSVVSLPLAQAGAILHAPLHAVPTSSAVPPRVVAALTRGLAKQPHARFAGMDELLAALRPPPARRRRALVLGLAAVAGAALWMARPPPSAPPPSRAERLERAQAELVAELAVAELPAALPPHVGAQLERYAARWAGQRADLELALHARPGDPATTTRLRCLDDARREATNLARGLRDARGDDPHAVELVEALPGPEECVTMPLDWLACSQSLSALAATAEAEPALTAMAAAARLEAAGDVTAAVARAGEAVRSAGDFGAAILRGQAGYLHGRLLYLSGRGEEAIAALTRARDAVEPTGCLDLRANIYSRLIKTTALHPGLPAAPAEEWSRLHLVLADATPDGGARLADAFNERGLLRLLRRDDPRGALADLQRAIELRERVTGGAASSDLADSYLNVGIARHRLGDLAGAEAALDEATRLRSAVFGPDHPLHYKELLARGELLLDRGALPAAEAALARAMALAEAGFTRDSAPAAWILLAQVRAREAAGDLAGAADAARRAALLAARVADRSESIELRAKAALLSTLADDAPRVDAGLRALAREADDPRVALETRAVVALALAGSAFNREEFAAARRHADRALDLLARAGLVAGSSRAQALRLRGLAALFLAESEPDAVDAAILDLEAVLAADDHGAPLSARERVDVELGLAAAYVTRERDGDEERGCSRLRALVAGPDRPPDERVGDELLKLCRIR